MEYKVDEKEYSEIIKEYLFNFYCVPILIAVACICFFCGAIIVRAAQGVFRAEYLIVPLFFLIILISYVVALFKARRVYKESFKNVANNGVMEMRIDQTEDGIVVSDLNGQNIREIKTKDIKKIKYLNHSVVIKGKNSVLQIFPGREEIINLFGSDKGEAKNKKSSPLGILFFWLTLISPMLSFYVTNLVGETEIFGVYGILRYSWVMWLFIPIGVFSIIIGIILKRNNQKYKKNLIIAYICLPLIVIFGSYRFLFNDVVSYDDTSYVAIVETKTNTVLPKDIKAATAEQNNYRISYVKVFDSEDNNAFKNDIEINSLWKRELSTKIKNLLPFGIKEESKLYDCYLFYNETKNEYNNYPSDGKHECIFLAYNYKLQKLMILDDFVVDLN